jgi:hypothetical protein
LTRSSYPGRRGLVRGSGMLLGDLMTSKFMTFLCVMLALSVPSLAALHVKVIAINHREGTITVLLPMHHATLEASLADDEPEIRVRVNEFYEAELVEGEVDTTKRNYLRVNIPDQKPAKFRLQKISFLE